MKWGDKRQSKYYPGPMLKTSLKSSLESLASSFASDVLDAIKGASLEELLVESTGGPRRGPGRPPGSNAVSAPRAVRTTRFRSPQEALGRRHRHCARQDRGAGEDEEGGA